MWRTVIFIICLSAILMALRMEAAWLVSLAILILLLLSGFALMFRGKLPQNLVPMLIALIVGPCIFMVILRALLTELAASWPAGLSGLPLLVVVLLLMTGSFLYVRSKIVGWRKSRELQGHTNEREFVLPANHKEGNEAWPDVERDQVSSEVFAQED